MSTKTTSTRAHDGVGVRERARSHEETDDRVEAVLRLGPKTMAELAYETGLCVSTIWFCVKRLVKQKRVRAVEEPKAVRRNAVRAGRSTRFEIDDTPEAMQVRVTTWSGEARRHPQDVALFGEYRRAP